MNKLFDGSIEHCVEALENLLKSNHIPDSGFRNLKVLDILLSMANGIKKINDYIEHIERCRK